MSAIVEYDPAVASKDERTALDHIERLLARHRAGEPLALVGADGVPVPLPAPLLRLVCQLVQDIAQNRPVAVLACARELTTQQAADLLNVSRPFLVKQLLDTGQIPFSMTGAHRRIGLDDVMAYKRQRDVERRQVLRELSQLSQQLGLE